MNGVAIKLLLVSFALHGMSRNGDRVSLWPLYYVSQFEVTHHNSDIHLQWLCYDNMQKKTVLFIIYTIGKTYVQQTFMHALVYKYTYYNYTQLHTNIMT